MLICVPVAMIGLRFPTMLPSHPMRLSFVRTPLLRWFDAVTLRYCIAGHPHREQWAIVGQKFRQRFHQITGTDYGEDESIYPRAPCGRMHVQVVRSVSDWSHGVLTEHSIQNACGSSPFRDVYTMSDDIL